MCNRLRQAARAEQSWMAVVAPDKQPVLRNLLASAHRTQLEDPGFMAEWQQWTGRPVDTTDGAPNAGGGIRAEQHDRWVMRDFTSGPERPRAVGKDFEADPLIAVIGSFHDLPLAQLQAGQAMQRVLLTATAEGLSASFLSQGATHAGHLLGRDWWGAFGCHHEPVVASRDEAGQGRARLIVAAIRSAPVQTKKVVRQQERHLHDDLRKG